MSSNLEVVGRTGTFPLTEGKKRVEGRLASVFSPPSYRHNEYAGSSPSTTCSFGFESLRPVRSMSSDEGNDDLARVGEPVDELGVVGAGVEPLERGKNATKAISSVQGRLALGGGGGSVSEKAEEPGKEEEPAAWEMTEEAEAG
jgi:hypothetical protein